MWRKLATANRKDKYRSIIRWPFKIMLSTITSYYLLVRMDKQPLTIPIIPAWFPEISSISGGHSLGRMSYYRLKKGCFDN